MNNERIWLRNLRESKQLSQKNIAKHTGVTRQHIGLIENGVTNPSPDVAKKIAEALGFDWTLFFIDESENKAEE